MITKFIRDVQVAPDYIIRIAKQDSKGRSEKRSYIPEKDEYGHSIYAAGTYIFLIVLSCLLLTIGAIMFIWGLWEDLLSWDLGILFVIIIGASIMAISSSLSSYKKYYGVRYENFVDPYLSFAESAIKRAENSYEEVILQNYIDCFQIEDKIDDEEKIIEYLTTHSGNNHDLYIKQHQQTLSSLKKKLEITRYDTDEGLTNEQKEGFLKFCNSYKEYLGNSLGEFNQLKSSFEIPEIYLEYRNGLLNLYIYPKFAIIADSPSSVEAYDLTTLYFHLKSSDKGGCLTLNYPNGKYIIDDEIPAERINAVESFIKAYKEYCSIDGISFLDKINTQVEKEKSYYTLASRAAENFYNFLLQLDNNEEIIHELEAYDKLDSLDDNFFLFPLDSRLGMLAYFDVCKCYEKLGGASICDDEQSLAFAIFIDMLEDRQTWKDEAKMRKQGLDEAQYFYETTKRTCTVEFDTDKFILLEIFRIIKIDPDIKNLYAVLLYRLASVIANVDGIIDKKERAFLSHILSFSDGKTLNSNYSRYNSDNDDAMTALANLIGLENVKKEVANIYNLVKIQKVRKEKGMKTSDISYHCLFTGNPGTGKTTVARIVAQIYKELGILKEGQLIETDRSGLVAEYVGQTAAKTNKIIDSAIDGVLFIDEAYSLIQGSKEDYGQEAIATLLKRMEDDRDQLVVILAGYTDEMKKFIDSNPGLQSRFNRYIQFDDYDADSLESIFEFNLRKYDYHITSEAKSSLKMVLNQAVSMKDKNFGNARYVRNLFEKTLENQARRLAYQTNLTEETLSEITVEDIPVK